MNNNPLFSNMKNNNIKEVERLINLYSKNELFYLLSIKENKKTVIKFLIDNDLNIPIIVSILAEQKVDIAMMYELDIFI